MSAAGSPIGGTESGSPGPSQGRERRAWERYTLSDSMGTVFYRSQSFPCQLLDISLGGCRVRMEQRFAAGALARVDVALELHGIRQRIAGMTQWTAKNNQLGIRFLYASPQAKNQLAALLTGLIDKTAAEAVKEVAQQAALTQNAAPHRPGMHAAASAQGVIAPGPAAVESVSAEPERTASQAVIRFLKDGFEMAGEVLDLSLEGCTLRMVRAFTLGIYVRVEVSFHVRGLVFQLAGVSQEIYDKRTVGFRFLDVSRRKREELEQVIEELRAEKSKRAAQG